MVVSIVHLSSLTHLSAVMVNCFTHIMFYLITEIFLFIRKCRWNRTNIINNNAINMTNIMFYLRTVLFKGCFTN